MTARETHYLSAGRSARTLRCQHLNKSVIPTTPAREKTLATFECLHSVTPSLSCYVTLCSVQVAELQSLAKAVPAVDYEELVEEMEKLNIADLLLIHRRVALP